MSLNNASYLGPIALDIGKYYLGSGPEFYGSSNVTIADPNGFDFFIPSPAIQLIPNEYLLLKISGTTDSIELKIGGSNSYCTSPSGSDWYPNGFLPFCILFQPML